MADRKDVVLNKRQAFLAILEIPLVFCLFYQFIWLFSRTTTAEIGKVWTYANRRTSTSWMQGLYKVDGHSYESFYLKDDDAMRDHYFEIRYLDFAPGISRATNFTSYWGPFIILFLMWAIIASIAYLRKDIVSDQALFRVQGRLPFVRIDNNQIEDYDQHDIDPGKPNEAEQKLKERLETELNVFQMSDVSASVYKFNPNAILVFTGYVFYFFWFFYSILTSSLGYPGVFFLGAGLVFIPLYVQNTKNPIFKAKFRIRAACAFPTSV